MSQNWDLESPFLLSLFAIFSASVPLQFEIIFASLSFGYISGSIPFGYLLPLLKGIDIRRYGSRNPGFTNVARNLGLKLALPVLLLDIAKGFLPTFFAQNLGLSPTAVGLGAVFGHLFTPFLGFRGGKGVATTFGILLALFPKIFAIGAGVWIITLLLSSYASLASLLFSIIFLIFAFVNKITPVDRIILIAIPSLLITKHIPNIKRLLSGKEVKTRLLSIRKRTTTPPNLENPLILFLGAGRWAQSLALLLAKKAKEIILWEGKESEGKRSKEIPEDIPFPPVIKFTTALPPLQNFPIIFFSLPSFALRDVLEKLKGLPIPQKTILISTIKGIEKDSTSNRMNLPSQIIEEYFPHNPIFVLAGPGIPYEIACGKPASLVIAGKDANLGKRIRDLLSSENLQLSYQDDTIGVELGGALKNVFAIACGIADGKGWGVNAKASLLTYGLREMIRLSVAMGAKPETLYGLSGIGDLILTSFSPYSRNYQFGQEIGRGKRVAEIIGNTKGVIEGISTCKNLISLAERYKIHLPIVEEVYKILFLNEDPEVSLRRLKLADE